MSDETTNSELPPAAETVNLPALRREALLPNERSRGLGTVAVVCTMAGVASGLALATTLMAMQVADTMSSRQTCAYRATMVEVQPPAEHGFLGIRYVFSRNTGVAVVDTVLPNTPAQQIGIQEGDIVMAVDGDRVDSANELQERIYNAAPGSRPILTIERNGVQRQLRPLLVAWPSVTP